LQFSRRFTDRTLGGFSPVRYNRFFIFIFIFQEHDFGVGSSGDVRYNIKVCGSLALTHGNPCSGQAGVCRYRTAAAGSDGGAFMTDAVNLGIMYR
jgi:hypothetical protein